MVVMSQQDLFSEQSCIQLSLPQADVRYFPQFIANHQAFFHRLKTNILWQQDQLSMYGKSVPIPRLNAWYGDAGAEYGYSGMHLQRHDWIPDLYELRVHLQLQLGFTFNSVLANYYRDGNDSVGWHSDDEKELGPNPVIASLSFGDARKFSFRSSTGSNQKPVHIVLEPGSLLLMAGETQHYWQHQLAKTTEQGLQGRINLTFRNIIK